MFSKPINRRFDKPNKARRAVVLMYHRINDLRPDPWTLCVSPKNFAEHLAVVRELTEPLSLGEIAPGDLPRNRKSNGKMPLAITFDDGFADNFEFAKPLLERFEIPATVFVAAERIGARREFWWDELERILLQPHVLPEVLKIEIGARVFRRELGAAVVYDQADSERDLNWSCIGDANFPTARHEIYQSLFDQIRLLPTNAQQNVLSDLFVWANMTDARADEDSLLARNNRRMMNQTEVVELSASEFVEIGAHTLTHPVLAALPRSAQRAEIVEGKRILERLTDAPVRGFAYPNGFSSDYTDETISVVREAEFEFACAAFDQPLTTKTNIFELPRVMVRDWNGQTFRRVLRKYLD